MKLKINKLHLRDINFSKYVFFSILIFILLFFIIHIYFLSLLLLLIIYVYIIPLPNIGLILRLFLSIILFSILISSLGYILTFLKIRYTPGLILIYLSSVVSINYLYVYKTNKRGTLNIEHYFPFYEIVALIFSLGLGIYLTLPLAVNHTFVDRIRQIAIGEDSEAHFKIINAIQTKKSFDFTKPPLYEKATSDYSAYPQAWHFNVAVLNDFIYSKNNLFNAIRLKKLMGVYLYSAVFTYVALIFLFTYLGLSILKIRNSKLSIMIIGILVSWYIQTFSSYYLFKDAFYPNIYVYAILFCIIILLLNLMEKNIKKHYFHFVIISLMVSSISPAYLFLWPPILFSTLLSLIDYLKTNRIRLFSNFNTIVLIILALGIPQFIYTLLHYSSSSVNTDGAICQAPTFPNTLFRSFFGLRIVLA